MLSFLCRRNVLERRDKTYLRNEVKLAYHYIWSYIYNTYTVRHNIRIICFENIYKTLMRLERLEQLEQNESQRTTSLNIINLPVCRETVFSA